MQHPQHYWHTLINPSTLTTNNLNVSGTTKLNYFTTLMSSLNVSGTTTLRSSTFYDWDDNKVLTYDAEVMVD